MERLYNVIVINERTGRMVQLNTTPVTHEQGCAWLSKLTGYKWRRHLLEEVK